MELPGRIFILGFMGCGKTTHGKKLAKKIGRSFIDLDYYIERKENKTIPEIFNSKGEHYFREIESVYLQQVISRYPSAVISLGGGTPCFNDNMNSILQSGLTVYIQMPAAALYQRLIHAAYVRPLFAGKSQEEGLRLAEKLLAERGEFYAKALLKVNGINLDTDKLLEALSLYIGNS